ncbi:MAG: glycosyl hydrolase, partial [Terriglobales bacterium]
VSQDVQAVPSPAITNGEEFVAAFLHQFSPASAWIPVSNIREGNISLPPTTEEKRELLIFIASRTGMMVKRAAAGADGFVVDHYDRNAVEHYLHNVGDRLMQALKNSPPYAIFCDSLEVYNSDWSSDFLDQFAKRRGYDLRPRLPALIEDVDSKSAEIRHDWGQTLTELFNERFASTVHDWANKKQTKLRMQAYGIPPAELSSSALVDLPEGEGAAWKELAATKWASSASHIYGVPITSSETWTWLHSPVFRVTPLDMKAEADRHFLQGINQLIGHGWPYTPENVQYPGWRFYAAAVFDEKNPWWLVMPDITKYLQRTSYVLRQGRPMNDVALYLPTDDAWAHFSPGEVDLFETLKHQLGSAVISGIRESGFDLDFFDNDAVRRSGKIEDHSFVLGSNRYRAVVLPGVERIPLDTYRKLEEFVDNGGILVATKRVPELVPGFRASDEEQAEFRKITDHLFRSPNASAFLIEDEAQLGAKLSSLLPSDVSLSPVAPDIGFIHRRLPEEEIYFLANTGNTRRTTVATFRVTQLQPEWWDPMSGSVSAAAVKHRTATTISVDLDLEPYGSRILVFSRRRLRPDVRPAEPRNVTDLSGGWRVTFGNGQTVVMDELRSWTASNDTRYFSGRATYEKSVFVSPSSLGVGSSALLDFGEGKPIPSHELKAGMQAWLDAPIREAAVVYVNGKRAGSLWCPPYSLDITKLLHPGENGLKVEVANLALNHMAGRSLPDYRLLNLRYGTRFEAQDMDKVQSIPAGLFGPIRLMTFGGVAQNRNLRVPRRATLR